MAGEREKKKKKSHGCIDSPQKHLVSWSHAVQLVKSLGCLFSRMGDSETSIFSHLYDERNMAWR